MKEIPLLKLLEEHLASLRLEQFSDTLIKKQFEIFSKEEEIVNDELRMQEVVELILE